MALEGTVTRVRVIPRSIQRINPHGVHHKWWLAAAVTLSGFLTMMSQTSVQVALPQIMTVYGLNVDQVQWVTTAYIIAGAILAPAVGWLGNRLGNRNLYLLSLVIFTSNAFFGAVSWSGSSLITFRTLQGIGGGMIPPMTMMFITAVCT